MKEKIKREVLAVYVPEGLTKEIDETGFFRGEFVASAVKRQLNELATLQRYNATDNFLL